jgi:hypothetical protein
MTVWSTAFIEDLLANVVRADQQDNCVSHLQGVTPPLVRGGHIAAEA